MTEFVGLFSIALIHFYHPDLESNSASKAKIVSEQAIAWFQLHQLLERWQEFAAYRPQIQTAERSLRTHRKYLEVRFEALGSELGGLKARGVIAKKCRVCEFPAAVPKLINEFLFDLDCRVCDHASINVKLTCPSCCENASFDESRNCSLCGEKLEVDQLVDAFVDACRAHQAAMDGERSSEANCQSCDGYQSVIPCGDKYLCTECFDVADGVEYCQWCNEPNTEKMEESYVAGCNFCEGLAGHTEDD